MSFGHLGMVPRLCGEVSVSQNASSSETDNKRATLGGVETGMRLRPVT